MSTLKVDGIRSNSATSDAITLANDGTCTAKITNNLSNRNLIINGAMQVAQRGTSNTDSGYQTVDRFFNNYSGLDEVATQSQVDVASGTTPYSLGFRKAYRITNGNQTSGGGAADRLLIAQRFEGQNIISSGWNYTSSSSYITIQFWVKSSVSQNFYFRLQTSENNSPYNYPMETGVLTADTWTKITKTVPGNSNLQINNDHLEGLKIEWMMFRGTDNTDSSVSLNTWAAYTSGTRTPDQTTTWYTTNDATFELTGVQVEVSDHATSFEHRSFAQELELCKRYYQILMEGNVAYTGSTAYQYSGSLAIMQFQCTTEMRITPTLIQGTGTNYYNYYIDGTSHAFNSFTGFTNTHKRGGAIYWSASITKGMAGAVSGQDAAAKIHFAAEM